MNEIMSTTNINIDDNNNNNEKYKNIKYQLLFWRVFKNKFLLKTILNKIQTQEYIEYSDHKQIYANNRIKFKFICSLEWMIKNKQYELLKCKLGSPTDEYIIVNEIGIRELFKMTQTSTETIIFRDLLKMLLSAKRIEMESINNLIEIAADCVNLEALKILLLPPYSFQVYSSTLEYILKTSNPIVLSMIMSCYQHDQLPINEETKKRSLQIATQSPYGAKMVNMLLRYSSLFTVQPPLYTLTPSNKSYFIDYRLIESYIGNSGSFGSLGEILVMYRIIYDDNIQKQKDKILRGGNPKIINRNQLKELHRVLVVELKTNTRIYEEYMALYDEMVEEVHCFSSHLNACLKYCIGSFSPVVFNALLSQCSIRTIGESFKHLNTVGFKFKQQHLNIRLKKKITPPRILEFIKVYTNQKIIKSAYFNNEIQFQILSTLSKDKKDYQLALENINCNFDYFKLFKLQFPITWNDLLSKIYNSAGSSDDNTLGGQEDNGFEPFIINDYESVDWVLKFIIFQKDGTFLISNGAGGSGHGNFINQQLFQFKNLKVFQYYLNNYLKDSYIIGDYCSSLNFLYVKSVLENNIQQLELLSNYIITTDCLKQLTINQIIILINYGSSNGSNVIGNGNGNSNNEIVSSYSLNLNLFPKISFKLLLVSIFYFNLGSVQFIIKNLDIKQHEPEILVELVNDYLVNGDGKDGVVGGLYDIDSNICNIVLQENASSINDSIEIFEILSRLIQSELSSSSLQKWISIFSNVLFHLYDKFIQIKGLKPLELQKVYKIMSLCFGTDVMENKQHSIYHSFHYINTKSKKLIKYIMNRPLLIDYLLNNDLKVYNYNHQKQISSNNSQGSNGFNISNYLNHNEFTFNYLFGNGSSGNGASFDEILVKLIDQLSHNPLDELLPRINSQDDQESNGSGTGNGKNRNSYFFSKINADLEYCLDIHRIDLFFKQLEFIQSLYDKGITIGSFPLIGDKQICEENKIIRSSLDSLKKPKSDDDNGELVKSSTTLTTTSTTSTTLTTPPSSPSPPYYFEFSTIVLSKFISIIKSTESIVKLISFNSNQPFFSYKLLKFCLRNSPKRTDVIDFLFNSYDILTISSWLQLIETNNYFVINHFVNVLTRELPIISEGNNTCALFRSKFLENKVYLLIPIVITTLNSMFKTEIYQEHYSRFIDMETQEQVLVEVIKNLTGILTSIKNTPFIDLELQHQQSRVLEQYISDIDKISTLADLIEKYFFAEIDFKVSNSTSNNMFTTCFKNGFIKLSCLFMEKFNQQLLNQQENGKGSGGNDEKGGSIVVGGVNATAASGDFKITNSLLSETIKNKKISIIKYYYENTDLITGNQNLLLHLKNELSDHYDYKFINWIKLPHSYYNNNNNKY